MHLEGIWGILAWPSDGAFSLDDLGGGCWGKGGHGWVAGQCDARRANLGQERDGCDCVTLACDLEEAAREIAKITLTASLQRSTRFSLSLSSPRMDSDIPQSHFRDALATTIHSLVTKLATFPDIDHDPPDVPTPQQPDALLVLLPLLIVLSTFLLLLLTFLICVLLVRRRRGIILRDSDGPVDMSREELIEGEGGFEGVESRWLEGVAENVRRDYLRAKGVFSSLSKPSRPLIRFHSSLFPQTTNFNILRIPCQPTSLYRSSSRYRKRVSRRGPSSPTMRPSTHSLSTPGLKLHSFPIPRAPPVCSRIFPFQS